MRRITSRQNGLVAKYRAAMSGDDPDTLLLDGTHLVDDALTAGLKVRHVMVAADALTRAEIERLVSRAHAAGADVVSASAPVVGAVSPVRSSSPIVALADRPQLDAPVFADARAVKDRPASLVVMACGVQDPGNLGAIARVAEAAGATGLMVAGASADPFGWKALRGSMGSALRLPIRRYRRNEDAAHDARQHGCRVLAAAPRGGRSLFETNLTEPVAIAVGGEGRGLDPAVLTLADGQITIPMHGPVESLNVAVTAALVLYEARRQRS